MSRCFTWAWPSCWGCCSAKDGYADTICSLYLIAYGVYRFLTEYIRPEPVSMGGLTFYQWVSLGLIAGMVGQWWLQRRYERSNNRANAMRTMTDTLSA